MSRSLAAWKIDREIGDLQGGVLGGRELFSYLRYNVVLDREWLQTNLGLDLKTSEVKGLQEMDKSKNMSTLALLGATASHIQIQLDYLHTDFDIC